MKIQKISWGSPSLDPLEACAFAARLGNRSVFILDPRLARYVIESMHGMWVAEKSNQDHAIEQKFESG